MTDHGDQVAAAAAGVQASLRSDIAPAVTTVALELPGAPQLHFRLLWDEAPVTCAAVVGALPESAECFHAIYSGTIAAFLLDPSIVAPEENATTCVLPGELLFTHYHADERHGHQNALSEVYWAYDRYARPTVPGQFLPVAANVFGRYEGDQDAWRAFAERCKRLRFDGTAPVQVKQLP